MDVVKECHGDWILWLGIAVASSACMEVTVRGDVVRRDHHRW
jgi:hypothetical protein